jgi:hypothetical protein
LTSYHPLSPPLPLLLLLLLLRGWQLHLTPSRRTQQRYPSYYHALLLLLQLVRLLLLPLCCRLPPCQQRCQLEASSFL